MSKSLEALKDISYLILQEVDDLKNKDLWKESLNTIKHDLEKLELIEALYNKTLKENENIKDVDRELYLKYKALENENKKLINKETPMKVIYENDLVDNNVVVDTWAYCPKCKEEIQFELWENLNYCPNCGQHLDWSDDDE